MSHITKTLKQERAKASLKTLSALSEADKEVAELNQRIHQLEAERDAAARALESLTPGGSEFAGDAAACVRYVRDALKSKHQLIVKFKRRGDALAHEVDQLKDHIGTLEGQLAALRGDDPIPF